MKIQQTQSTINFNNYKFADNRKNYQVSFGAIKNDINSLEKQDGNIQKNLNEINSTLTKGLILSVISTLGIILAIASKGSKTNKKPEKIEKIFQSLASDNSIPVLSECKSFQTNLKKMLEKQVAFANADKDIFEKVGKFKNLNRMLLFGPPGNGKTFYAKVFAKTVDAEYAELSFQEINSRWAGVGVERLEKIFENIIKTANENSSKKYVLVCNEIDAMIQPLEKMSNSGLSGHTLSKIEERTVIINYLDRLKNEAPNITIIGTTNASPFNEGLDSAIISRFKENLVEVDFPKKDLLFEAIKAKLLKFGIQKEFIDNNTQKLEKLVQNMENKRFSFRDLDQVIEKSNDEYLLDYIKNKNSVFKYDYLQKAMDEHFVTDGRLTYKS